MILSFRCGIEGEKSSTILTRTSPKLDRSMGSSLVSLASARFLIGQKQAPEERRPALPISFSHLPLSSHPLVLPPRLCCKLSALAPKCRTVGATTCVTNMSPTSGMNAYLPVSCPVLYESALQDTPPLSSSLMCHLLPDDQLMLDPSHHHR